MSHHRYLAVVGLSGLVSWSAFAIVLFKMNPLEAPGLPLGLFFITLFLSLLATFTIGGFYIRYFFYRDEVYYKHLSVSFRQSFELTLVSILCLVMQIIGVLTWWSSLLLLGIMILIELYFFVRS
jgi:hypothetical protein